MAIKGNSWVDCRASGSSYAAWHCPVPSARRTSSSPTTSSCTFPTLKRTHGSRLGNLSSHGKLSSGTSHILTAARLRKVLHKFGRYPHRNEVLKRSSSDEENAFLSSDDSTLYIRLEVQQARRASLFKYERSYSYSVCRANSVTGRGWTRLSLSILKRRATSGIHTALHWPCKIMTLLVGRVVSFNKC